MKKIAVCLLVLSVVASFDARARGGSALYLLEYRVTVPPADRPGESLSIWIPFPAEDEYQRLLKSEVVSPFKWEIRKEGKFGTRLGLP